MANQTERTLAGASRSSIQGKATMDRRLALRFAAVAALGAIGLGLGGPALAQSEMVLKSADVHPFGYPTVEAVKWMGEELEKRTDGRLSVEIYPSMQLGGEKEMIEQAQVGALAMARISVGPMGPLVPELNVFNLPFLFRDAAHMEAVIDGPIGDELLQKLTDHPTAGPGRPVLDERRHAQRLQQPAPDPLDGGSQGPEDPDDGQPDLRRHHERDGRQRRLHGLRPAHQRAADRRGRRRREQLPDLRERPALPLRQVLLAHRASDDPGDPGLLEAHLGRALRRRTRS